MTTVEETTNVTDVWKAKYEHLLSDLVVLQDKINTLIVLDEQKTARIKSLTEELSAAKKSEEEDS